MRRAIWISVAVALVIAYPPRFHSPKTFPLLMLRARKIDPAVPPRWDRPTQKQALSNR
jgi:hypothetical protein